MLEIKRFVFNNFGENTYLAIDKTTNEAALIDPGMISNNEKKLLNDYISLNDIKLTQIILTHAHLDHTFGADYARVTYNVPVKLHAHDIPLANTLPLQCMRFGLGNIMKESPRIDVLLKGGDTISIGKSQLHVLHTPGHSPGGICLYDKDDNLAFVGDSIFQGSIGRTDLEGGNYSTLINSLKIQILSLPDDTILYPGHGEPTTVGMEKKFNPFLNS